MCRLQNVVGGAGARRVWALALTGLVVVAAGCAAASGGRTPGRASVATDAGKTNPKTNAAAIPGAEDVEPAVDLAADRAAIRSMAGTFRVTQRYAEEVSLVVNRASPEPYVAQAVECVLLVEETPRRLTLQHLLVLGEEPLVVKFWREDWRYGPVEGLTYLGPVEGGGRWTLAPAADLRGRWVRTVYGADDDPQYGAAGTWRHGGAGGASRWLATAAVAAPAPRHERDRDPAAAWVEVRDHVVAYAAESAGAGAWRFEQEVTKYDARGREVAVETGVVRYARVEATAITRAGEEYWAQTAAFWRAVRAGWARRLAGGTAVTVRQQTAAGPRWRALFDLSRTAGERRAQTDAIRAVIDAATTDGG